MKTVSNQHSIAVEEFTTPCPIIVPRDTRLGEVKRLMEKNGIRHIPVVENNIPVGIISDRDIKLFEKYPNKPWNLSYV